MEVTARICFTRPCLGNIRRPDYDRMPRDGLGTVIFMVTWWRAAFAQAAKAINRYHSLVDKIRPALQVRGEVTRYKRWYSSKRFTTHECFDAGCIVEASFLLPHELKLEEFVELLETMGLYIGISPYGWVQQYGLFRVLSVAPTCRKAIVRLEAEDGAAEIVDGPATS